MADRYLLESGTPDGYLLEDGSGVLILETTAVYDAAFYAAISQLVESFRNVRDRSLYQDGEKKVVQGSAGVGSVAIEGFDPATFPGIGQLSNSFRNIRIRSLYAGESDNLLAAFSDYDPLTMSGWISALGGFRSLSSIRYQQDTNQDIAWAEPTQVQRAAVAAIAQLANSFRYVRNRSLYKSGEKRAVQGSSTSGTQAGEYDPQIDVWVIPSHRVPGKPYWNSPGPSVDWITIPVTAAAFDPATHPWAIQSDVPRKARPVQMAWTKSGFFVSLFYNPAQAGWTIDSQLVPSGPWWTGPNINVDWLPPEIIAEATFDTRQRNNVIDSQRVPGKPYWTNQWQGTDWITPELLAELAHDPQYEDWTIKTNTYKSRAWWTDSPMQQAWLIPAVIFHPPLFPATGIPSHRELPKAKGLWQPDLDNAWQFENPVVPNFFNASFVTSANIVEDAGGSPERSS